MYIFYSHRISIITLAFFYISIYVCTIFGRSKTEILSSYDLCVILNLILTAINTVFLSSDYCSSLAFKSPEQLVSQPHISSRKET